MKIISRGYLSRSRYRMQYLSDLHLEYKSIVPKIKPVGTYLALLGDIGNPYHCNYRDFLTQVSYKFEKVFVIPGNHEYWNHDNMDATINQIVKITSRFPNLYLLNNDSYQLDDITILGTTLWSEIGLSNQSQYNKRGDHANILYRDQKITVKDINKIHNKAVAWLEQEIPKSKKTIVLTHHLPSYQLIIPKYRGVRYEMIHDRFASHLDYLIQPSIVAWLSGHSHCRVDMKINGVFCSINAIGHGCVRHLENKTVLLT